MFPSSFSFSDCFHCIVVDESNPGLNAPPPTVSDSRNREIGHSDVRGPHRRNDEGPAAESPPARLQSDAPTPIPSLQQTIAPWWPTRERGAVTVWFPPQSD